MSFVFFESVYQQNSTGEIMQHLKDSKITGPKRHVAKLRKLFGLTYFGTVVTGEVELELTHVLANRGYVGVDTAGTKPSISRAPLYVVVPSRKLDAVWAPSKNQLPVEVCTTGEVEVRFGPASQVGNIHICNAVGIRIDKSVLYLCLDPNGRLVDDTSNMGV